MSNVDPSKPSSAKALTSDIRANFAIIKTELEAIQAYITSTKVADSPQFTGTASMANASISGSLTLLGSMDASAATITLKTTPILACNNVNLLDGRVYKFGPIVVCYIDAQAQVGQTVFQLAKIADSSFWPSFGVNASPEVNYAGMKANSGTVVPLAVDPNGTATIITSGGNSITNLDSIRATLVWLAAT